MGPWPSPHRYIDAHTRIPAQDKWNKVSFSQSEAFFVSLPYVNHLSNKISGWLNIDKPLIKSHLSWEKKEGNKFKFLPFMEFFP